MIYRRRLLLYGLVIASFCLWASAAYAAAPPQAELQLAGIRLGRSALTVIQKYGNPTEIRVGAAGQVQIITPAFTPTPVPTPNVAPYPSPPGMTMPGMLGPNPFAPAPSISPTPTPFGQPTTNVVQRATAPQVTWVYSFPKNKTLEFIISPDGLVVQIAAFGAEWSSVRTSKGITLGETYKDVILKYGFPESHERAGHELVTRYAERNRALFTFVGKTLVGITIALMD